MCQPFVEGTYDAFIQSVISTWYESHQRNGVMSETAGRHVRAALALVTAWYRRVNMLTGGELT
jgi:hypothetical protein